LNSKQAFTSTALSSPPIQLQTPFNLFHPLNKPEIMRVSVLFSALFIAVAAAGTIPNENAERDLDVAACKCVSTSTILTLKMQRREERKLLSSGCSTAMRINAPVLRAAPMAAAAFA
jgi:hypothetical protein